MVDYSLKIKTARAGFTLLELLVVMGIMIMMMGIGLTGWLGMRRGAEMRGAVSGVRTTLLLARQQAVTKRLRVTVTLTSDPNGDYMSTKSTSYSGTNSVHATVYLPKGIKFTGSVPSVTFTPVGTVNASGPQVVNLVETAKQKAATPDTRKITVWPLTGVTKVSEGG